MRDLDSDSSQPSLMEDAVNGRGAFASSLEANFGYAFNDSNFSDRLLHIEIVGVPAASDSQGCTSFDDCAKRKSRRGDWKRDKVPDGHGEQMNEESPSGDDSNWDIDCLTVLETKTLHISSPILAAKSSFFCKLFSSGMRESEQPEQRHITLQISASEEAALMELLNFMYSNEVSVNTVPAVLDVLMAADKFEVASCMRYCCRLLRTLPMTTESALLYLELPSSISMAEAVQPLIDAAKEYLAARYKNMAEFEDEVMALPLAGLEAILPSDDLHVIAEDIVYLFVMKWAKAHYPKLKERQEILRTRLLHCIRFPFLTRKMLKYVLTCKEFFDDEMTFKLVTEALIFKAEAPHRQRILAGEDSSSNRRYVERAYKLCSVKIVEFELPRQQCLVYLDLKREECETLFPSGGVCSQPFPLGGQGFFFLAQCNMDQQSSCHYFGLFLGMQGMGSVSCALDCEFSVRSKPTEKFICKYKGNYTFRWQEVAGRRNLFGIPWNSFLTEDSPYFINGVLHLRAQLTIRQ